MFAIAFDLVVADTEKCHPKGVSQANLFKAIMALKSLVWVPQSVRDIRAFRIEQWSDFTGVIKD